MGATGRYGERAGRDNWRRLRGPAEWMCRQPPGRQRGKERAATIIREPLRPTSPSLCNLLQFAVAFLLLPINCKHNSLIALVALGAAIYRTGKEWSRRRIELVPRRGEYFPREQQRPPIAARAFD